MFTGIIRDVGLIRAREAREGDVRMVIGVDRLDLGAVAIGDSICVQGVCLTVTELLDRAFAADVSRETLSLTTLGRLDLGAAVNLEPALRAGEPLGGHLVSGHVDGVAQVVDLSGDARSLRVEFAAPPDLSHYIARKGSVAIDGVSLTVNEVEGERFSVNLIPHTRQVTTLGRLAAGTHVNLEVDQVARYLERMLAAFQG